MDKGKFCFDVVRIHKFGHLDIKTDEDTDATKLPSFKSMQEFASQNETVKLTLGKEKVEAAKIEFENVEDWRNAQASIFR